MCPDDHALDIGAVAARSRRELRDGPVMVEPGHRGELGGVEMGRVTGGDEAIGIGGVTHHQHFHVAARPAIDRCALAGKYLCIGLQQILALHAGAARPRAHQQTEFGVTECDIGIVGLDDVGDQGERAILDFHDRAGQGIHRRCDFEQLQDYRLILAKHFAGGDTEQQGITDLTRRTRDRDPNWFFHVCSFLLALYRAGALFPIHRIVQQPRDSPLSPVINHNRDTTWRA